MNIRLLLFAFVLILASCSNKAEKNQLIRSVYVTQPQKTLAEGAKSYSGIIEEADEIKLGFKIAGEIKKIYCTEGDYVRKGELLAELDDKDYKLETEALQIQYDQVKKEVERISQLFKQNSISANDYEKADAGLRQLAIQLQGSKNKLSYTKLYAPTDGYVRDIAYSAAEMLNAGSPIITILDVSKFEVTADIPVAEYQNQKNFTTFNCYTNYTGSEAIPMRLISLTPKADNNQLYRLRLAFAEKMNDKLTAGMNVSIKIGMTNSSAGDCTLPLCAIFKKDGNSFVWTLSNDSITTLKAVEIVGIDENGDAVVSGLDGDEIVVRAGVNSLTEGEKVKVIEKPSETNVGGLL